MNKFFEKRIIIYINLKKYLKKKNNKNNKNYKNY